MVKIIKSIHKQKPMRKIIVTAALPYANGEIHLGHLIEYLQADFWTRYQKMIGNDCRYFCADDTHGTPIMIAAEKQNISPEKLIKRQAENHLNDFKNFEIDFDHYSSTHSPVNKNFCEQFYAKMKKFVYQKEIEQAYCPEKEMFLPDRFVVGDCPKCGAKNQYGDSCDQCGATYSPLEMANKKSTVSNAEPIAKKSNHLFFALKDFQDFLKKWVNESVDNDTYKKLQEWLDGELQSWNISRDKPYFGFEIPEVKDKYFYVWVDAPLGYVTATKEWADKNQQDYLQDWQQDSKTEIYHFIGKDIVYFHALFWIAMLKANEFNLPKKLFVHGFLTINGKKMSKSKGTFINAKDYLSHLEPTYLRYYFASKINGSVEDVDLDFNHFIDKINSELLGKITNLASRGAQMLQKKMDGKMGELSEWGKSQLQKMDETAEEIKDFYEERQFNKVIDSCRQIADETNRYFDDNKPWVLIKENPQQTKKILTDILHVFRIMVVFLNPIFPSYASKVINLFKENISDENKQSYQWQDLKITLENKELSPFEHLLKPLSKDVLPEEWF